MASQQKGEYRGIMWESTEELHFLYWLFELKDKEYISRIERGRSISLSDPLITIYLEHLKTKTKEKTQTLLEGHIYTPEFLVQWEKKAVEQGIVWQYPSVKKYNKEIVAQKITSGIWISWFEVKPIWDHQNMTREFKINQKWVWQYQGMFINLIFPTKLFKATFTPSEYLYTEKRRDMRSIMWEIKTIDEFLKEKEVI